MRGTIRTSYTTRPEPFAEQGMMTRFGNHRLQLPDATPRKLFVRVLGELCLLGDEPAFGEESVLEGADLTRKEDVDHDDGGNESRPETLRLRGLEPEVDDDLRDEHHYGRP